MLAPVEVPSETLEALRDYSNNLATSGRLRK